MSEERAPSTRGLIDSDIGPLRRFTGIFDGYSREPQTYNEGMPNEKTSQRLTMNFSDIEVLEATEPYHFPVYQIQMTESNRKKSRYGVWGESLNSILDSQYTQGQLDPTSNEFIKPSDRMDLKDCVKKRIGMVMADGEDGRPEPPMLYDGREQKDKPTPTWTVYEIEGVGVASGGVSAKDLAEALLNGKTLAEFNKEALANSIIRNDPALLQSISMPASAAGSFANTLVKAGRFTKDASGTFHKVGD